jgi:adenosyl cobinamide kinase/adenosyl cobinamide phosphate guanylyltransferase
MYKNYVEMREVMGQLGQQLLSAAEKVQIVWKGRNI